MPHHLKSIMDFWRAVVGDQTRMYVKNYDGTSTASIPFNPFALCDSRGIVAKLYPGSDAAGIISAICNAGPLFTAQQFMYLYNPIGHTKVNQHFPANSSVFVEFPAVPGQTRAKWGACRKNSIVVRKQYLEIIVEMFRPDKLFSNVLLNGASGIGKTVFGFFLMAFVRKVSELVRAHLGNQLAECTFLYRGPSEPGRVSPVLFLTSQNNVANVAAVDIQQEMLNDNTMPTIEIADSSPSSSWFSVMEVFIGSSNKFVNEMKRLWRELPSEKRYNPFMHPVEETEHVLCSGTFANGVCDNWNSLQYLRDIFGATLRYTEMALNAHALKADQRMLALVQQSMNDFFVGRTANAWEKTVIFNASRVIAETLESVSRDVSIEPDSLKLSGLFMQGADLNEESYETIFNSAFLTHLAMDIHESTEANLRQALKKVVGASGYGFAFEYLCHGFVMDAFESAGGIRHIHSVSDPNVPEQHLPATPVRLRKHYIRTWSDIATMPGDSYGYPLTTRFPLIDAVVKLANGTHILFQATVAQQHESDAVGKQRELYNIVMPPAAAAAAAPAVVAPNHLKAAVQARRAATAAVAAAPALTKVKFVYLLTKDNFNHFIPGQLDGSRWEVLKVQVNSNEAKRWIEMEPKKK